MQNKMFQVQSPDEKRDKLASVLGRKTNHLLSKFQTQQILNEIDFHRQYSIRVHIEPETFFDALFLCRDQGNRDTGKIAFGNIRFGIISDTFISNPSFSPKAVACCRHHDPLQNGRRSAGIYQSHSHLPSKI